MVRSYDSILNIINEGFSLECFGCIYSQFLHAILVGAHFYIRTIQGGFRIEYYKNQSNSFPFLITSHCMQSVCPLLVAKDSVGGSDNWTDFVKLCC